MWPVGSTVFVVSRVFFGVLGRLYVGSRGWGEAVLTVVPRTRAQALRLCQGQPADPALERPCSHNRADDGKRALILGGHAESVKNDSTQSICLSSPLRCSACSSHQPEQGLYRLSSGSVVSTCTAHAHKRPSY